MTDHVEENFKWIIERWCVFWVSHVNPDAVRKRRAAMQLAVNYWPSTHEIRFSKRLTSAYENCLSKLSFGKSPLSLLRRLVLTFHIHLLFLTFSFCPPVFFFSTNSLLWFLSFCLVCLFHPYFLVFVFCWGFVFDIFSELCVFYYIWMSWFFVFVSGARMRLRRLTIFVVALAAFLPSSENQKDQGYRLPTFQ